MKKPQKRFILYPLLATSIGIGVIAANATTPPTDYNYELTTQRLQQVQVTADGETQTLTATTNDSIETLLNRNNIKLNQLDRVSPTRFTTITPTLTQAEITRVEKHTTKTTQPIEYKKTVSNTKIKCDTPQITQKGEQGERTITWEHTTEDGKEVSKNKISDKVTKQPVDEILSNCLPKPVIKETQTQQKSNTTQNSKTTQTQQNSNTIQNSKTTQTQQNSNTTPTAPKTNISGSKQDWMRAAGIPESDWQYVDYIVSRESGWNPSAKNPRSSAFGLAQNINPSSYSQFGNMYDPVVQLKWQYNYVKQRYGGYAGAYNFWIKNHWY